MTQSIDDAFTALGEDLKPLGMAVQPTGADHGCAIHQSLGVG